MIRVNSNGVSLFRQLEALRLTNQKKKRINRSLARKVAMYARKNIREQSDIYGHSFKKRADVAPEYDTGRRRGKMLRNITKAKHMKVKADAEKGTVYFSNPLIGTTAKQQQDGWTIPSQAAPGNRDSGSGNRGEQPATKRQAQRLLSLGFKARTGKRGYSRPPLKWIPENMTINQAGLITRILDTEQRAERRRGSGQLPGRAFLGVRDNESRELSQLLVDMIIRERRY